MDILGRSYMLHTSESLRVKSNVLLEEDVLKCFFQSLVKNCKRLTHRSVYVNCQCSQQ